MKYFFRFGKTPNLSYAELLSCLRRLAIDFEVVFVNKDYAVIEMEIKKECSDLLLQLGGTVKIGSIIDSVEHSEEIKNLVINDLGLNEGRKIFGLTSLSPNYTISAFNKLGIIIKKEFDSARFVTSKEKELSSVIVTKEKLLERGGDYYILNFNGEDYLAKTLAVQDFADYDHRDFDRPRSDSKSGMMPPKLCQMMINLAEKDKDAVLWDPFCGSGTVLQEALLLGFTKVIGSDSSEKAIDDTQFNLEWLAKEYGINIDDVTLYQLPIEFADDQISDVEVVVTEPYLGPPLRGIERREYVTKIQKDLETLYLATFKKYSQIVKKGGCVVSVVPVLIHKSEKFYLDILKQLKDLGFELMSEYENLENIETRHPLVYSRKDQKVLREIMVFKKR